MLVNWMNATRLLMGMMDCVPMMCAEPDAAAMNAQGWAMMCCADEDWEAGLCACAALMCKLCYERP